MYGTSKAAVADVTSKGKICILDIDVQGVQSCKEASDFEVGTYIFISPPALDELRARLSKRATDSPAAVSVRLANAQKEIDTAKTLGFDHWIVNDDLDAAFKELQVAVAPLLAKQRPADDGGDGASAGAGAGSGSDAAFGSP